MIFIWYTIWPRKNGWNREFSISGRVAIMDMLEKLNKQKKFTDNKLQVF